MRRTLALHASFGMVLILALVAILSAQRGERGQQTPEQAALQAARVGNSTAMELEGAVTQRRKFGPGTRTYWHSHAGGFIFFVQKAWAAFSAAAS
jgi:hypothetical protein